MRLNKVVILYSVVLIGALAYFRPFAREAANTSSDEERIFATDLSPGEVVGLWLERNGRRVEYRAADGDWQLGTAGGKSTGRADVAGRIVSVLTAGEQAVEIVNDMPTDEDLAAFGLSPAKTRIGLHTEDGREIILALGSLNPSGVALYARTNLSPAVLLVGFNVGYYVDLALEERVLDRPHTNGRSSGA